MIVVGAPSLLRLYRAQALEIGPLWFVVLALTICVLGPLLRGSLKQVLRDGNATKKKQKLEETIALALGNRRAREEAVELAKAMSENISGLSKTRELAKEAQELARMPGGNAKSDLLPKGARRRL